MGKEEEKLGINKVFNQKIEQLIQGYSQAAFSEKVNLPESTLKSYLRTKRKTPSISSAISIAEKCNVSLDWLFGRETKIIQVSQPTTQELFIDLYRVIKAFSLTIRFQNDTAILSTEYKEFVRFLEDIQNCKSNDNVHKIVERYSHLDVFNGKLMSGDEANQMRNKEQKELQERKAYLLQQKNEFIYQGKFHDFTYKDLTPLIPNYVSEDNTVMQTEIDRREKMWSKLVEEGKI